MERGGVISTTTLAMTGYLCTSVSHSRISRRTLEPASQYRSRLLKRRFGLVPDGGLTVMLLGAALSGLGLLRRKLA